MNKIVLCDRFFDSTVAYQGYGRGVSVSAINQIQNLVLDGVKPDYTFWIKKSPTIAAYHLEGRSNPKNRFDVLNKDFFSRVDRGYKKIAEQNPERVIIINGELSLEQLKQVAIAEIKKLLK